MAFDSLHQVLGRLEHQDSWHARRQFQRLLACWVEVVGVVVAAQTRPIDIQRRILQVATSSSAWAQTLAFERQRILAKLNPHLSEPLNDIRFSTAQWQSDRDITSSLETDRLWQKHPSRVAPLKTNQQLNRIASTPDAAFQQWSKRMQARVRHLPLCPQCHCPTPTGELERWSVCSLCITKQW